MPLNLRKYTGEYKLIKLLKKINHQIYMDNISFFAKNEKRIGNRYGENIQSGDRDGIGLCKMCHALNEKRKSAHDGRNGTINKKKNKIRM